MANVSRHAIPRQMSAGAAMNCQAGGSAADAKGLSAIHSLGVLIIRQCSVRSVACLSPLDTQQVQLWHFKRPSLTFFGPLFFPMNVGRSWQRRRPRATDRSRPDQWLGTSPNCLEGAS
jgi:hypothetical protein